MSQPPEKYDIAFEALQRKYESLFSEGGGKDKFFSLYSDRNFSRLVDLKNMLSQRAKILFSSYQGAGKTMELQRLKRKMEEQNAVAIFISEEDYENKEKISNILATYRVSY